MSVDLNAIAVKAMENIVASGVIEKKVEEAAQKAIEDIIRDTFSWSSPMYKELKAVMQEKLQINFRDLDLPIYNEFLLEQVKNIIKVQIEEGGANPFGEQITKLLKHDVKPEYTLYQLIEEFKEMNRDEYDPSDEPQLTLHISKSEYGNRHIYIDKEDGKNKWDCEYRFCIDSNDNHIFGIDLRGEDRTKDKANSILSTDAFGDLLLRIKAAGSKVVVTSDNVDDYDLLYFGEEDY